MKDRVYNLKNDMKNECLESAVKILKRDVTNLKTDFRSMESTFTNLKVKMETSNAEKILTVKDEPSPAQCQICKS